MFKPKPAKMSFFAYFFLWNLLVEQILYLPCPVLAAHSEILADYTADRVRRTFKRDINDTKVNGRNNDEVTPVPPNGSLAAQAAPTSANILSLPTPTHTTDPPLPVSYNERVSEEEVKELGNSAGDDSSTTQIKDATNSYLVGYHNIPVYPKDEATSVTTKYDYNASAPESNANCPLQPCIENAVCKLVDRCACAPGYTRHKSVNESGAVLHFCAAIIDHITGEATANQTTTEEVDKLFGKRNHNSTADDNAEANELYYLEGHCKLIYTTVGGFIIVAALIALLILLVKRPTRKNKYSLRSNEQ